MNPTASAALPRSAREMSLRLALVAERLRERLLEVARIVAGPAYRPSRLVELLHLDKSLASRILRSLRSETSYELLHLIPSPTGLGIFLDRAERHGCTPEALQRARAAVAEFQEVLAALPGGRSALDALMSESVAEVRERAERTASQSVYRAMSYLLGFRCEAITSAVVLHPSADGRAVDSLEISRREGIRRLRPSAPVAVFSVDLATDVPREAPRMEPLRPEVDPGDPHSVLLPEFCEPASPPLELYRTGTHTVFALPTEGDESLERGTTISSAFRIRNGYLRHRRGEQEMESRTYLLHYPCKLLVRDIFIRDDLYPGIEPQLRLEFPAPPGSVRPRVADPTIHLNQLDIAAPVLSLGRGLGRPVAAGASQHARLLARSFELAGEDPERYRGYRARIEYPVPMITMGWWIPLPPEA